MQHPTILCVFGTRPEVVAAHDMARWLGGVVFDTGTLTEDYEIGFRLHEVDAREMMLHYHVQFKNTPPAWFAGANQGLDDQSLRTSSNSADLGVGLRQRLLKDHVLIASAEWLHRDGAVYHNDAMLRLSGSHSVNTDWQPVGSQWTSVNLYADSAWLLRAESYYLTAAIEAGEQYRAPWLAGKSSMMPFISSIATANTDNPSHTVVSRVDLGVGVAIQTWHGADAWRAPDLRQRLSLEIRQAIAGNSDDRFAVLLRWGLFH